MRKGILSRLLPVKSVLQSVQERQKTIRAYRRAFKGVLGARSSYYLARRPKLVEVIGESVEIQDRLDHGKFIHCGGPMDPFLAAGMVKR